MSIERVGPRTASNVNLTPWGHIYGPIEARSRHRHIKAGHACGLEDILFVYRHAAPAATGRLKTPQHVTLCGWQISLPSPLAVGFLAQGGNQFDVTGFDLKHSDPAVRK